MLAKEDSEIGQASNKESLRKGGIKGELRLLFWLCLIRNVYSISEWMVQVNSWVSESGAQFGLEIKFLESLF